MNTLAMHTFLNMFWNYIADMDIFKQNILLESFNLHLSLLLHSASKGFIVIFNQPGIHILTKASQRCFILTFGLIILLLIDCKSSPQWHSIKSAQQWIIFLCVTFRQLPLFYPQPLVLVLNHDNTHNASPRMRKDTSHFAGNNNV